MKRIAVAEWTTQQVTEWLNGLDSEAVSPHLRHFSEVGVDGARLMKLNVEQLRKLKVTDVGQQEVFLEGVEHLLGMHEGHHGETCHALTTQLEQICQLLLDHLTKHRDPTIAFRTKDDSSISDLTQRAVQLGLTAKAALAGAVADILTASKKLVCWLDRNGLAELAKDYDSFRDHLLRYSLFVSAAFHAEVKVNYTRLEDSCEALQALIVSLRETCEKTVLSSIRPHHVVASIPTGNVAGMGFSLKVYDGALIVNCIVPKSAAAEGGEIQRGDELIAIESQTVVGWQFDKVVSLLRQKSQSNSSVSLTLLRGIIPQANGGSSNGSSTSIRITLLPPPLVDFLARKMHVISKHASPGLHRASSSPNLVRDSPSNPVHRVRQYSQRKASLPTDSLQNGMMQGVSFPFYSGPKFSPARARIINDVCHERNASAPSELFAGNESVTRDSKTGNIIGQTPTSLATVNARGCASEPLKRRQIVGNDEDTAKSRIIKRRSRPSSLHLPEKMSSSKRASEGFYLDDVGLINPSAAGVMKKLSVEKLDVVKARSDEHLVGLHKRGSAAQSSRRKYSQKKKPSAASATSAGGATEVAGEASPAMLAASAVDTKDMKHGYKTKIVGGVVMRIPIEDEQDKKGARKQAERRESDFTTSQESVGLKRGQKNTSSRFQWKLRTTKSKANDNNKKTGWKGIGLADVSSQSESTATLSAALSDSSLEGAQTNDLTENVTEGPPMEKSHQQPKRKAGRSASVDLVALEKNEGDMKRSVRRKHPSETDATSVSRKSSNVSGSSGFTDIHQAMVAGKPVKEVIVHSEAPTGGSTSKSAPLVQRLFNNDPRIGVTNVPCRDLVNPDCEGWLTKLGAVAKTWKRRWCVLKDFCLYYYKTAFDMSALGVITLPSYNIEPAPNVKKPYAFKATHHNMRTFHFVAENASDMERWMTALIKAAQMERIHNDADDDGAGLDNGQLANGRSTVHSDAAKVAVSAPQFSVLDEDEDEDEELEVAMV